MQKVIVTDTQQVVLGEESVEIIYLTGDGEVGTVVGQRLDALEGTDLEYAQRLAALEAGGGGSGGSTIVAAPDYPTAQLYVSSLTQVVLINGNHYLVSEEAVTGVTGEDPTTANQYNPAGGKLVFQMIDNSSLFKVFNLQAASSGGSGDIDGGFF